MMDGTPIHGAVSPRAARRAPRSQSGSHSPPGRHSHAMVCVRPSSLNSMRARSCSPLKTHVRPSRVTR
jgi:hypothetical protein